MSDLNRLSENLEIIHGNEYPSCKNYHALGFRFQNNEHYNGVMLFNPEFISFVVLRLIHLDFPERLKSLTESIKTSYDDMLAKVVSETSDELLEHPSEFKYNFEKSFIKKLSDEESTCFNELGALVRDEYVAYSKLFKEFNKVVLKGEETVDYLINSQNKLFPLDFYTKIRDGLKVDGFTVHNPQGVWKGVLLKNYFGSFINKENVVVYASQMIDTPSFLRNISPFG